MASLGRTIVVAIGVAGVLIGILAAIYVTEFGKPAGPDLSRAKKSMNGIFMASIKPENDTFRQGELHSWILTLETAATGKPVENAAIDISGGMPKHNHGLPTSPQVTNYLGEGHYRIEGVKFSMSGWWQLRFNISAAAGSDTAVFNIML